MNLLSRKKDFNKGIKKSLLVTPYKAIMRCNRKGDMDRVVCSIHKVVNVVKFLCQEPEEASEFISRVKSRVKVFIVHSNVCNSGQDVSYSDILISHVTVRGLEDIQHTGQ